MPTLLKNTLSVFNVGQADSLVISPIEKCDFEGIPILIDCGQGNRNVFRYFDDKPIILLLSHSHEDHIGGLSYLFNGQQNVILKELWLPLYSDEIAKIANFIFSLKGVFEILGASREEYELKNITSSHRLLNHLFKKIGCETIRGLAQGDQLCTHISIYNPPLDPDSALGLPKGASKSFFDYQRNNKFEELRKWLTKEEFDRLWGSFIAEGWDYSIPNIISDERLSWEMRMHFIYGFFYKYKSKIDKFVRTRDLNDFKNVAKSIKLSANDISVVIEYQSEPLSCLLTGDIGKKTLRKCLSKRPPNSIKAFKFPHHGSKNSLDVSVLEAISPEVVIVSHNNGKFGRQKDPHPHMEVLNALKQFNTIYTNDVIKNGNVVIKKSIGNGCVQVIELEK
jgi:beta-lactamase superfamily II metal-dependent hydrolase